MASERACAGISVIRRVTGPSIVDVLVAEIRRIGIREVARRAGMPDRTLTGWVNEPGAIRLAGAFKVIAAIGASLDLTYLPPSPMELERRRVRYHRRSPEQRAAAAAGTGAAAADQTADSSHAA